MVPLSSRLGAWQTQQGSRQLAGARSPDRASAAHELGWQAELGRREFKWGLSRRLVRVARDDGGELHGQSDAECQARG